MKREKGIIAYGTELDRQKLAVLAVVSDQSGSEWIVTMIRRHYDELFEDTPPERIMPQQS